MRSEWIWIAVGRVMTDHCKAYNEFLPHEKHISSKAQTYTVEGCNSIFKHFLARLRRRTKCYSKSKKCYYYQ
jgi:insertion element IS1 protein InsB